METGADYGKNHRSSKPKGRRGQDHHGGQPFGTALGAKGKKTLLVDVDPQGNSSSGVGVDRRRVKQTMYEVLIGETPAQEARIHTEFANLDLLPSSMDLAGAELELIEMEHRESILKNAIVPLRRNTILS